MHTFPRKSSVLLLLVFWKVRGYVLLMWKVQIMSAPLLFEIIGAPKEVSQMERC